MPIHASDFKPGLVLVRKIAGSPLGYHYGIWATVDEVIHASKTKRIVACDSVAEFSAGLDVSVSDFYLPLCSSTPDLVVARARAEIGRWSYELMDGNCEAFVHWCATGTKSAGLQMGAVKLLGNLADTLVIAPAKAARERDEAHRELQRLLLANAKEDDEAHRELKNAAKSSTTRSADVVTSDEQLEQMVVLHGDYQAILHRSRERHRRRTEQYLEVLRQGHLPMLTLFTSAEKESLENEADACRSLIAASSAIGTEIRRYLFAQHEPGSNYEKIMTITQRLHEQAMGRPREEPCEPAA
jgi:hypothetical protein